MLKNYIKIAIRNIIRNKVYSLINVFGLTLGISCCCLLFMFVIDELSFDTMHSKKDQIYRVVEIDKTGEDIRYYGMTTPPVGPTLMSDYQEIDGYARLFKFGGHINFSKDDTKYAERSYYFADSTLFQVFDFEWIHGDPATALSEPYSIVIDEDWAQKFYGNENPIGKELIIDDTNPSIIKGVIKKLPQNSHLQFKILVSYPAGQDWFANYLNNWSTYGCYTYVLLNEKAKADQLSSKIPGFIEKYFNPEDNRNFYLQPLTAIRFNSKSIEFGTDTSKGEKSYIYIFIAIGVFMLLIASINYMNLATAKSMHRAKEIGMRKVSGAMRFQLVFQFLSESTFITFVSLLISIGLVDLLLPYFNDLTDKEFVFNLENFGSVFGLLFVIAMVVGLLAGSYPAFMLSKLKPATILKGNMNTSRSGVILRKTLVVTQFSLSIIMIIATIVVSNQMSYIQNLSLGFNKDHLMTIDINNGEVRSKFETMKTEFANNPYVKGVAVSSRVPGEWKNLAQVYVQTEGADSLRFNYVGFDHDMIDVYQMQIVAGKNFNGNVKTDSLKVIINESAAQALNLNEPVGKYIELDGGRYQIQGVVRNFNFQSLHNEIAPIVLGFWSNTVQQIDYFSIKFDPDYTQEVVAHATSVHDSFDNFTPVEIHFLDDQWDLFYKDDQRAGSIFTIGAGITIFIACLGLFGLASFVIQKRTKEIGVRKVLGASILDLFVLLSKSFAVQVLVAFIIAAPISWYFMSEWLDNFAFRFDLSLVEFLIGGFLALVIALLSVSYKVIQAARLNPANTLKDE